jgi:hypothetical protein
VRRHTNKDSLGRMLEGAAAAPLRPPQLARHSRPHSVQHHALPGCRDGWHDTAALAAHVEEAKEVHYKQLTEDGIQAFDGAARLIRRALSLGMQVCVSAHRLGGHGRWGCRCVDRRAAVTSAPHEAAARHGSGTALRRRYAPAADAVACSALVVVTPGGRGQQRRAREDCPQPGRVWPGCRAGGLPHR